MEAFSLLKYWKPGADSRAATETTAVVTSVAHNKADEEEGDGGDDGPFFDIEFAAVADEDESTAADGSDDAVNREDEAGDDNDEDEGSDCTEEEGEERNGEFNFTLSDDDGGDGESEKDRNLQLSPADDLFFKGKLVPLDSSSSLVLNSGGAESNLKNQFPTALLKSATKIRVFLLRFKKMKSSMAVAEREESNGSASSASSTSKSELQKSPEATQTPPPRKKQNQKEQSKFFTVKFKVEEVPIVSLFTRENSTRIASPGAETKPKQCATAGTAGDATETTAAAITEEAASDEKRFSKDVLMQKYLKMVKPLYVRASKRYGEKLRFSGQLTMGSGLKAVEAPPQMAAENLPPAKSASSKSQSESAEAVPEEHESPAGNVKNLRNIPAGLRVVCKRLGKSRSASAAVAAVPAAAAVTSKRRDDSLLEQQDGIQSAILHCKRSFNGSRESESTQLPRSTSDPSQDKSMDLCRKPAEGSSANTALIEAS